jgi:hypothetical protein
MTDQGEIPLAAPGLIGPISILNQPVSGPRSARRQKNRPYAHLHLEVQLKSDQVDPSPVPAQQRLETLLGVGKIVEVAGLLRMAGGTLHALSARGFRRVDHWEVSPGGWLPVPPRSPRPGKEETVGHLVKILEGENATAVAKARSFSVRLSDFHGNHVDVVVLRVHRQSHPAISLDFRGYYTRNELEALKGALSDRLPVLHTAITKYQYAAEK